MFFPLVIIIVGVIMLLENLGVITGNIWEWVWPSLIVILGLSMLFKPSRRRQWQERAGSSGSDVKQNSPEQPQETTNQNEEVEEGEFEEKK